MRVLLVIATLIICTSATFTILTEWNEFKAKYGKSYTLIDEILRKTIFIANWKRINLHNSLYDRGQVSFKLGINQFSDMTLLEFQSRFRSNGLPPSGGAPWQPDPNPSTPPASIDWRGFGATYAVQDQGNTCNAGWAFAAVASLEGQSFRAHAVLPPKLSEQNLIDCVSSNIQQSTGSCYGGNAQQAFGHIVAQENINTGAVYPYTGKQGACRYNPSDFGEACADYQTLPMGDEDALKKVVGIKGPVAVGFDPNTFTFMHYASGVYNEVLCRVVSSGQVHSMAVVGYGTDPSGDFWIVKNSFGITWGESGYIRVARNKNNQCGIATSASYPIV